MGEMTAFTFYEWISVEERLPEPSKRWYDKRYWVFVRGETIVAEFYGGGLKSIKNVWSNPEECFCNERDDNTIYGVTHWMLIDKPGPPLEAQEGWAEAAEKHPNAAQYVKDIYKLNNLFSKD